MFQKFFLYLNQTHYTDMHSKYVRRETRIISHIEFLDADLALFNGCLTKTSAALWQTKACKINKYSKPESVQKLNKIQLKHSSENKPDVSEILFVL
jgi:hypothetical protein